MVLPGTKRRLGEAVQVGWGEKRVRVFFGGELLADTRRPLLVWEFSFYPAYYIPAADVRGEALQDAGEVESYRDRGEARRYTVRAGGKEAQGAALRFEDSPVEEIRDTVRFDWAAMDAWFEEDEEVFTHARNPYTRIDILSSSRHVRVEVAGQTVAESTSPQLLFETALPVRYYMPKTHVRMDLLTPTDRITQCPYKGDASWWSVRAGGELHENLAWSYRTSLPESARIAGLVAFLDEKVDVYVDGVQQERPRTHFA